MSALPFEGIIFDMDGVLLISSAIHEAAYRVALHDLAIRKFDYPALAGLRTREGICAVLAENGVKLSAQQIDRIAGEKSRIALERILAQNPIAPGSERVLRELAPRHKLALASSASPAAVDAFVDRNRMRELFCCVVHSGDVSRAKPDPEIFELAIRRLGVPPAQTLVVEDAVAGIEAAKAAGAVACGIPNTCSRAKLEQAGADLIIERLEDLLTLGGSA